MLPSGCTSWACCTSCRGEPGGVRRSATRSSRLRSRLRARSSASLRSNSSTSTAVTPSTTPEPAPVHTFSKKLTRSRRRRPPGLVGLSGGRFGPSPGSLFGALMLVRYATHPSAVGMVMRFLPSVEFALFRDARPFDTEADATGRTTRRPHGGSGPARTSSNTPGRRRPPQKMAPRNTRITDFTALSERNEGFTAKSKNATTYLHPTRCGPGSSGSITPIHR
jgi:hypothetical protein